MSEELPIPEAWKYPKSSNDIPDRAFKTSEFTYWCKPSNKKSFTELLNTPMDF